MAFTGIKDTDFLILNQLSDYELGKVCQVNKYAEKLCKDDTFWLNRISQNVHDSINKNFEIYSKYVKGLKRNTDKYPYITNAKNFYGFKTNIDFYKFLKYIVDDIPSLYFYILLYAKGQTKLVDLMYTIDKNKLPHWINYEEFIYHLRKKILEVSINYSKQFRKDRIVVPIPTFFTENIPGFQKNNNSFIIPDAKFILDLLGEVKRDPNGIPLVFPNKLNNL
jgi:hypothetical protein